MSRTSVLAIAFAVLSFGLGACGGGPSTGDCEKLLDHIVDLEIARAGAEGNTDLAKQRKEFRDGVKDEFMPQCTDQTPKSFVDCALKKKSLDDLGKCDGA